MYIRSHMLCWLTVQYQTLYNLTNMLGASQMNIPCLFDKNAMLVVVSEINKSHFESVSNKCICVFGQVSPIVLSRTVYLERQPKSRGLPVYSRAHSTTTYMYICFEIICHTKKPVAVSDGDGENPVNIDPGMCYVHFKLVAWSSLAGVLRYTQFSCTIHALRCCLGCTQ